MNIYIYRLIDPFTNETRYIGKSGNIKNRFRHHTSQAKFLKSHVGRWINTILQKGGLPILEIIEECHSLNWEEKEIYWISYYKALFPNLCNIMKGGNEPPKPLPHVKKAKFTIQKGKYRVRVSFNGHIYFLGQYATKEEAEKIYNNFKENPKVPSTQVYSKREIELHDEAGQILTFKNVTECAKYLKTSTSNISRCLKGKAKTHKSCTFNYKNYPTKE